MSIDCINTTPAPLGSEPHTVIVELADAGIGHLHLTAAGEDRVSARSHTRSNRKLRRRKRVMYLRQLTKRRWR